MALVLVPRRREAVGLEGIGIVPRRGEPVVLGHGEEDEPALLDGVPVEVESLSRPPEAQRNVGTEALRLAHDVAQERCFVKLGYAERTASDAQLGPQTRPQVIAFGELHEHAPELGEDDVTGEHDVVQLPNQSVAGDWLPAFRPGSEHPRDAVGLWGLLAGRHQRTEAREDAILGTQARMVRREGQVHRKARERLEHEVVVRQQLAELRALGHAHHGARNPFDAQLLELLDATNFGHFRPGGEGSREQRLELGDVGRDGRGIEAVKHELLALAVGGAVHERQDAVAAEERLQALGERGLALDDRLVQPELAGGRSRENHRGVAEEMGPEDRPVLVHALPHEAEDVAQERQRLPHQRQTASTGRRPGRRRRTGHEP